MLSDFGELSPFSCFSPLLLRLLIRKKFFNFWGKWPLPLRVLLEDIGRPEKMRFSFGVEVGASDELKSCVIEKDEQLIRELLLVKDDVGGSRIGEGEEGCSREC